ncbi:MAG: SRPBCC domain-containing protein [Bacteroidia bacterium]|nr:SRPBCC domain-containing protein [Bacteroidia bacterium]
MNAALLFDFQVDKENNQIHVKREFAAGLDLVWEAWTNPEILDLWWAPKPYQTRTKSMDFREGGNWLYCMEGPQGEKHWCRADYTIVNPKSNYAGLDAFCDEFGKINEQFPRTQWSVSFQALGNKTMVSIRNTFQSLNDLETIIKMGFKEGFTMALENLDQYIEAQVKLRTELKSGNQTRVCMYLNFPGSTEQAFLFYRQVFRSEFSGQGIQRFEDIPSSPGNPPVLDSVKKMVLHVELPIVGGFVLMGTDAPREMGFELNSGNTMHISVEPESRTETERIFNELSEGGTITMPLKDMFFGAYYGSLTDKFGINWMVNFKNT